MASSKTVEFDFNGQTKVAYWNGKEYAHGTVYFNSVRKGGTCQTNGSYSKESSEFKFKAGEKQEVQAAAKALGFIE